MRSSLKPIAIGDGLALGIHWDRAVAEVKPCRSGSASFPGAGGYHLCVVSVDEEGLFPLYISSSDPLQIHLSTY